jgi:hypothetical protein
MKYTFYRIYCLDPTITECYVGQTTQSLKKRINGHKHDSKTRNHLVYRFIREHGGWDFWTAEELETRDCCDKTEVAVIERQWIDLEDAILNTRVPDRERDQWVRDNKKHLDRKRREYYEANRDAIIQDRKSYYVENREAIMERQSEKITCGCGVTVRRSDLARHKKSKTHQRWVNNESPPEKIDAEERNKRARKKVTCECGIVVNRNCLSRHKKSNRHQARMAALSSASA